MNVRARISPKRQAVLPNEIRDALDPKPGACFAVAREGRRIVSAPNVGQISDEQFKQSVLFTQGRPVSVEDMEDLSAGLANSSKCA